MILTELEAWLEYSHSPHYPGDPKSESSDIWFPRPDFTHEDKIDLIQNAQGSLSFAEIIGIVVPGGALHLYHGQTDDLGYSLYQVDCRDHRAGQAELFLKLSHMRLSSAAP